MVACALVMYALCSVLLFTYLFVYLSYFYFMFSDDDRLEDASMRESVIGGLTQIVGGAEQILRSI